MIGAVIFSNTIWTFWDVMFLFFVFIPLVSLWFFCMFDIFGRRDLSGWGKAAWLVAVVVLPWIGSLAYLIFRPASADASAAQSSGVDGANRTTGDRPAKAQVPTG